MTISSEITKLINNLAACYTKCTSKGATIPQDENFDNLADCINSIPTANLTSLSVTPSTTAQTLTPSSPYNGFNQVDVSAINLQSKFVTADSPWFINITPDSGYDGLSSVGVTLNNESRTVTPSTMPQNIFPSSGHSGISDVTVDAVTAAIDSNITAGNIKRGVRILGVSGTLAELNGTTTSITPTTSSQTVTPSSPYNGFTSVTVPAVTSSIDANITAGNIKKDVQILGVTGTYEGSGGGSKYFGCDGTTFIGEIDANGTLQAPFDSTYIDNIVFTGVKDIGIAGLSAKFNNENATGGSSAAAYTRARSRHVKNISFPDLVSISGRQALYSFCNYQNSTLTNVSFPQLSVISGNMAMQYAFQHSTLVSVDLSSLTTVSGSQAMQYAFQYSALTSLDLSNLTPVSGGQAMQYAFKDCASLTSLDLSSLTTVSGSQSMRNAFQNCTSLTSVDLSSLTTLSGSNTIANIFTSCSNLTSVDLSGLKNISADSALASAFSITSLATLSFPSLTSTSFGNYNNQFNNMLYSVTGCTVHFPSNLQSVIGSWSSVTSGFGGTNTTVLFDLPATT